LFAGLTINAHTGVTAFYAVSQRDDEFNHR